MFFFTLLLLQNSTWAQGPDVLYRNCLIETAARTSALTRLEELKLNSESTLYQKSNNLVAQVQAEYRKMNQTIFDKDILVEVPAKLSAEQRRIATLECEKLNFKLANRIEYLKNRIFSARKNPSAPTLMSSQNQEKAPRIPSNPADKLKHDPGLDGPEVLDKGM
jgi:predicted secreted protein